MCSFAEYSSEQSLYPYIAFSYDPKTTDRESGQGVKRWHTHLIGRTKDEKRFINENTRALATIDKMRARRLVDETSIIGSNVIYDDLEEGHLETLEMRRPFNGNIHPLPFVTFALKDGWQTLQSDEFLIDFNRIHQSVLNSYRNVIGYLSDGKSGQWQRPFPTDPETALVRIEGMSYLSAETKLQLLHVFMSMKPSILKRTDFVNRGNRDLTTHVFPMSGPCYSTSICEVDGDIVVGIRPYLFSDLGGAGVGIPYGVITKIKKGDGVLNELEMQERRDFQLGFINFANLDA